MQNLGCQPHRLTPSTQRIRASILSTITVVTFASAAIAQPANPRVIPFQGRLTDSAGAAVTGSHNLTFSLYLDASAVSPLWQEVHSGISLANDGRFSVTLGKITSLDDPDGNPSTSDAINLSVPVYLGVKVDSDAEMRPRKQVLPAVHAHQADLAKNATSADQLVKPGTTSGAVSVDATGNVGIGTPTPTAKLDVQGEIRGFGVVPIGTIMAWHKNYPNVPALPSGWVECNGQQLTDPGSPFNSQSIPNLNAAPPGYGRGYFIRGGHHSGDTQDGTIHYYGGAANGSLTPQTGNWVQGVDGNLFQNSMQFSYAGAQVGTNTGTFGRSTPLNVTMVWIMRVK